MVVVGASLEGRDDALGNLGSLLLLGGLVFFRNLEDRFADVV